MPPTAAPDAPAVRVSLARCEGSTPREVGAWLAVWDGGVLGSIGGGLALALKDELHREAALITFLVTLSGVSLAGIGSAFWGVVAGALTWGVQSWRRHA